MKVTISQTDNFWFCLAFRGLAKLIYINKNKLYDQLNLNYT